MKTVKVTADNRISVMDVDFDDFRDIQNAIGGYFETVRSSRMLGYFGQNILMLVDEEGFIKGLPFNRAGSWLYGRDIHGNHIAGDFILAVPVNDTLTGLDNPEAIKDKLMKTFGFLKEDSGDGEDPDTYTSICMTVSVYLKLLDCQNACEFLKRRVMNGASSISREEIARIIGFEL